MESPEELERRKKRVHETLRCPYTARCRSVMDEQGNVGFAYRLMYHRERDRFYCVSDVGFTPPPRESAVPRG